MKNHPMDSKISKKKPTEWWVWIFLGFVAILIVSTIFGEGTSEQRLKGASTKTADTIPAEIRETMSDEEKARYISDPGSAGFNDSDRQFLKEHGMTEQEARAAETVLRQNGIN